MSDVIDIRDLRDRLGWNQDQLGSYCGVDRSTVSRWEKEPPTKGPALILLRQLQARAAEGAAQA
jgi:DNA-binding transcriptional regulator YiaG